MFSIFKKNDTSQNDPFSAFGINKKMMITALKQMQHLNPSQKQQITLMLKKQIKRDFSKEEIARGAEELGKQLKNEFSEAEIERIKKDLIDLLGK